MSDYKTPGVYIQENSVLSGTISAVETAIPAFVGYTQKGFPTKTGPDGNGGKILTLEDLIAVKISSMDEFMRSFGGAPTTKYELSLAVQSGEYYLYRSMEMFYRNGGGECYITSVGSYEEDINKDNLILGITKLEKYEEPTMVVVPDAIALGDKDSGGGDCYAVQQEMVNHCKKMLSRVAILDIWGGYQSDEANITNFRDNMTQNLDYAAAYYPWLNTTALSLDNVGYQNIIDTDLPQLQDNLSKTNEAQGISYDSSTTEVKLESTDLQDIYFLIGSINQSWIDDASKIEVKKDDGTYEDKTDDIKTAFSKALKDYEDYKNTCNALASTFSYYRNLMTDIQQQLNLLPPSGVMAGIYTYVDNTSGVGQAPANYGINGVQSPNGPTSIITHDDQRDLNKPLNGKAINAIRYFKGKGTLIWGARTLLGNSGDWRYINVRRSVIMIETSIGLALEAYVFSPNTTATWIDLQTQINAFLTKQWNAGILVGNSADEAFQVAVGIGTTMTPQDVIDGIMKISVKLAVTRPAEFIEVTFQQMMPQA